MSFERNNTIHSYLNSISDKKCLEIVRDIVSLDIERTIEVLEKGINPLSKDSPYVPHFAGRIFLKYGEEELKNRLKLNSKGIRKLLAILINSQEELSKLNFDKESGEEVFKDIYAKLDLVEVKRSSFYLMGASTAGAAGLGFIGGALGGYFGSNIATNAVYNRDAKFSERVAATFGGAIGGTFVGAAVAKVAGAGSGLATANKGAYNTPELCTIRNKSNGFCN
ncbi:hypothetical protein [Halobacteriovorax sp. HLS]|uniref:hypothetical protein n=1 Tax=Halobacteriovorax sp. HLS TaxID=2234000 RepID=UPI000FD6F8FF|nr:hypothetical protein [Halobacteriovorax sp. HLS]